MLGFKGLPPIELNVYTFSTQELSLKPFQALQARKIRPKAPNPVFGGFLNASSNIITTI